MPELWWDFYLTFVMGMGDLVWDFLVKPSNVGMGELWWDGPRWVAVGCGLCTMHSTVGWDGGSGGGRAVEFGADPAEQLVILRCFSDLEFIYIYDKSSDPAEPLVIL